MSNRTWSELAEQQEMERKNQEDAHLRLPQILESINENIMNLTKKIDELIKQLTLTIPPQPQWETSWR